MKELGRFDPDMEMFVEPVKEPDLNHLNEIKWRLENNRLEGDTAAEVIVFQSKSPQEHVAKTGDY